MDGRESRGPPPPADLLVCFPSRTRLTLMPKAICSPARPPDAAKRYYNHNHHHHLRKSSKGGAGGQTSSPVLWAKTNPTGSDISEPTSPRVTCAGQIKIKPKAGTCKNWQSVMEEIERLHNNKHKKRGGWAEALGFKKDVMQFLTCLRRIKFDFRCFGSFSAADYTSEEEEDEDEDESYEKNQVGIDETEENENSKTVFSKWFMVLQEEQQSNCKFKRQQSIGREKSHVEAEPVVAECAPPPNALLLMRCRSAPAKSWMEEEEEEEEEEKEKEDDEKTEEGEKKTELVAQEEKMRRSNSLAVLMKYDTDFYKLSSDIAKETWVVGGFRDPLSRCRSGKK